MKTGAGAAAAAAPWGARASRPPRRTAELKVCATTASCRRQALRSLLAAYCRLPSAFCFLLSAFCLLLSCGLPRAERIVVGSKNFTEQAVLGELIAQHLESKTGLPVERRFYLAGSYICHQAVLGGRIDLYPEYTGTALTAILKEKPQGSAADVYNRVREEYLNRFGLAVTAPLGFDNTFAIVIRGEDARRLHLHTISEAARYTPQWRAGFGYEFMERPDGYQSLAKTYGLKFAAPPRIMELGLLYRALKEKQVDLVAGSATDGLIAALDMVVLEDDRHYFPPYEAVPIVRQEALAGHPAVRQALADLGGRISAEEMRRMNYAVDGEHRDAKEVAREFLKSKGL
ncbi:MAG: ABC transporter substrate-binding protein [Acidobacteria bacterium]|nr:MAG: ABC transporter substrate-binding protein [Acidobacteriota bacterium]